MSNLGKRIREIIGENSGSVVLVMGVLVLITVVIMPFRIYSALNAVHSMMAPQVKTDLEAPYNLPMLTSDASIDLIGIRSTHTVDIGYAILGELRDWGHITLSQNDSVLIAHTEDPVELHFRLRDAINTLGGLWRGKSVIFAIPEALDSTLRGTPGNADKKWGGVMGVSSDASEASPKFGITLPVDRFEVDQALDQRAVTVTMRMNLVYPAPSSSGYRDRQSTLTHEFNLIVLDPDEVEEYQAIKKDYFRSHLTRVLLTAGAILGSEIVLLALAYWVYRVFD